MPKQTNTNKSKLNVNKNIQRIQNGDFSQLFKSLVAPIGSKGSKLTTNRRAAIMDNKANNMRANNQSIGNQIANTMNAKNAVIQNSNAANNTISQSGANFAKIYSDPFNRTLGNLPAMPAYPSQPIRVIASGFGSTNAAGNGWITITPAQMATNNIASIFYSIPTSLDPIATGPLGTATSNSPYVSGDYTLGTVFGKAMRIVALGLRVRYTGTMFNASGLCTCVQLAPSSYANNANGKIATDLRHFPGYKEYTFADNKWHAITRHIISTDDYMYQQYDPTLGRFDYLATEGTGSGTPDSYASMAIYLSTTLSAGPQPFEWEISAHYEIIGPNLPEAELHESNHRDIERITAAYGKERNKDNTTPDHSVGKPETSWISVLKKGAETVLPLIPEIISMFL